MTPSNVSKPSTMRVSTMAFAVLGEILPHPPCELTSDYPKIEPNEPERKDPSYFAGDDA